MRTETNIVLDVARKKTSRLMYRENFARGNNSGGMFIRPKILSEKINTTIQINVVKPI